MEMYDIIEKKKRGEALTEQEIAFFVEGVTDETVEDYKAASLLMAISLNGMNREETYFLTKYMLESGGGIDLSGVEGVAVDKHSTGGVSDSTTLVIAPILAACGVKVAKMSGRALGHTGGTVDKLESFPGYDTALTKERFVEIVNEIGLSVTGQTGELVPADRKLYQLRDLTATVESVPLIASSIMSKKLATGVDHILLDVKYGRGAFMEDPNQAVRLARCMVDIGTRFNKDVQAVVTSMEQPLGCNIGCNAEVREAVEVLKGKEGDLAELCRTLSSRLLVMAGTCDTLEKARTVVEGVIESGEALVKLRQLVAAHGGDASAVDDPEKLARADYTEIVKCEEGGTVTAIDCLKLGQIVVELGGGRKTKLDNIDHTVGVELLVRVGSRVEPDSEIALISAASRDALENAKEQVLSAIAFDGETAYRPLVYAVVTEGGVRYEDKISEIKQLEDAVMDYEQDLSREAEEYKYKSVVEKIELTMLSQTATPEKLKKLCDDASEYHFATVCVLPTQVAEAVKNLGENSVKVCTVVGFPYGEELTGTKVAAAKSAVKAGAAEIDMVMCVTKAKQGNWKYVTKEIAKVVKAAGKHPVKVIIETALLTEEEIRKAVKAVADAKASYVKTSTGLFGGATMDAVKVIKDELTKLNPLQPVGIKASGGIKTKQDAFGMLYAGATRIGTSRGVEIANELKAELIKNKEAIGKISDNV